MEINKKVLVLIADGNEEMELIGTVDVLRRASIEVTIASVMQDRQITSAHGVKIEADVLLADVHLSEYDMLILPGGLEGTRTFQKQEKVQQVIKAFYNQQKYLGAICAAPVALATAQVLTDKKAVCYPGFEQELDANLVENQSVVVDGNIITAQGVAYTIDFALRIVEMLKGTSVRDEVATKMLYKK